MSKRHPDTLCFTEDVFYEITSVTNSRVFSRALGDLFSIGGDIDDIVESALGDDILAVTGGARKR